MKNLLSLRKLLIVLLLSTIFFLSVEAKSKIFLLHPTVGNIENFMDLIKMKLVDIPDLEIVGVYHEKEESDYSRSEKYLAEKNISNYHLLKIKGELTPATIYGSNDCSQVFKEIVDQADAILFFGGPDIQPSIYGEKQHLLTVVTDPYRHLMETSFLFHLMGGTRNPGFKPLLAAKPNLIVRGFCLGMQTMNVAAGGTLVQDIPTEVYHISTAEGMLAMDPKNRHRNYNTQLNPLTDLNWAFLHPVKTASTGYLHDLVEKTNQKEPWILSSHHQGVGAKAKDLEVTATSLDGKIVEGLQHKIFREVVGVQFHPEASSLYNPEAEYINTPDEKYSPNALLIKEKSLAFHQLFWKDFSDKVKAAKK